MNCPCCDSTNTQQRRNNTQSNGIRLGGWLCLDCRFSWSTINGRITTTSLGTVDAHRRNRLYTAIHGDRSRLTPELQDKIDRLEMMR